MPENDGRFPDESDVLVRYPAPGMTSETPWETWPWMHGVIEAQCGPDEWQVTVYAREVAELEDGSPAPDGTADDDMFHPGCFRRASELKALPACRHCGGALIRCEPPHAVPVCLGWKHTAWLSMGPVGAHYCEGRSVNPSGEPATTETEQGNG
jgi:hypothetical protein